MRELASDQALRRPAQLWQRPGACFHTTKRLRGDDQEAAVPEPVEAEQVVPEESFKQHQQYGDGQRRGQVVQELPIGRVDVASAPAQLPNAQHIHGHECDECHSAEGTRFADDLAIQTVRLDRAVCRGRQTPGPQPLSGKRSQSSAPFTRPSRRPCPDT